VLPSIRIPLLASLLLGVVGTLAAQSTDLSPSPTLPSDTLEATQPVDSFPTDPFLDDSVTALPDSQHSLDSDDPRTSADSAALQDIRSWIDRHPRLMAPPPVRAILVRV
jgi:hypothetical protein